MADSIRQRRIQRPGTNVRSASWNFPDQYFAILKEGPPSPEKLTSFLKTYPNVLGTALGGYLIQPRLVDPERPFSFDPGDLGDFRPHLSVGVMVSTAFHCEWRHLLFCQAAGRLFEKGIPFGPLKTAVDNLAELGIWCELNQTPAGPSKRQNFITNSLGMKFAWVPPGTFWMGSPDSENGRRKDEILHRVTLTEGFYLAIHPVTQAYWREVVGNKDTGFQGEDLPIECVSWDDSQDFLCRLGERDGNLYRLPTEAEWEYSCRAGTTSPFCFGDTVSEQQAIFSGSQTSRVGAFPPNAWGLHDMHGNVWEWCSDRYGNYPTDRVVDPKGPYTGKYRVLRGGSFFNRLWSVRSASRSRQVAEHRGANVGFRPVMVPKEMSTKELILRHDRHEGIILAGRRDHLDDEDREHIERLRSKRILIRSYDWLFDAWAKIRP